MSDSSRPVSATQLPAPFDRWPCQTLERSSFPPRLLRATRAAQLQLLGEQATLYGPAISIVGTRRIPLAWARRLRPIIREIIQGTGSTLISGGALGVDTIAHEEALACGVPSVVVLASGLAHAGPRQNQRLFASLVQDGGSLISDKATNARPYPSDFLERNTLIASLSDLVIVAAAPVASGAMRTAHEARRFGVPVLTFPGPPDEDLFSGNMELLRTGAQVCTGLGDVARMLGQPLLPLVPAPVQAPTKAAKRPTEAPTAAPAPQAETPLTQLRALLERGSSLDEAGRQLGVSPAELQILALELEVGTLHLATHG